VFCFLLLSNLARLGEFMRQSTWTDRYQQWQETADALCAKHKRIQRLAFDRSVERPSFSLTKFYDRYRIRFNQSLDRISTL